MNYQNSLIFNTLIIALRYTNGQYSMQTKELRWRAYYGFNPNDYYTITEKDIERVKYAQIAKVVTTIDGRQINGSYIQRIEEDFRHYTGWYDSYSPKSGEDNQQLQRDVPYKLLQEREQIADERVRHVLKSGKPQLLETPETIKSIPLPKHLMLETYEQ